jgi:hypothetical protein
MLYPIPILEVLVSNLGRDTDYLEGFVFFPQLLLKK